MSLYRTLVSGRAAVGWSSFRCDGTFLWTHAILPSCNLTPYLRPLSGGARSRRPPRTCAALSAPARWTWAAAFDIARHGYVNLTAGRAGPGTADTSAMVAARARFLGRGHYRPLAAALQSLAARHDPGVPGLVADLAGGTGYYLAGVLDALPHRHGACLARSR
jgi:hypothetical protein